MSKSIIARLKEEHGEARQTLEALSKTTDRGVKIRSELLAKLERELTHHMILEEEIFYPCFKSATERKKDKQIFFEAKEEHRAADKVLRDLLHTDVGSLAFGGKVKVLKELVEHHIDEEENEMFALAREILTEDELVELGDKMAERKEALQSGRAWDRSAVSEYTQRLA